LVVASGGLATVVVLGIGSLDPDALSPAIAAFMQPTAFFPATDPLSWPQLSAPMLAVLILALAPLPLTVAARSRIPDAARTDVRTRSPRPAPELVGR
jgi:energy-coupling factor transport system permease protein